MVQMLDGREAKILDFIVRSYIRSAEPVASSDVRSGLQMKESPATVRNVIAELDDEGFLEQPHTSAGRVPTDRAYRYFVDYLIYPQKFKQAKADNRRGAAANIRSTADALHLLAIAAEEDELDSYGLSYLLREPEFRSTEAVRRIAHLMDHTEEIFDTYRESREQHASESRAGIFIGRENPVREAVDCSVFYMERDGGGAHREMLLVGPTRVNYERISAFISKFFNEYD